MKKLNFLLTCFFAFSAFLSYAQQQEPKLTIPGNVLSNETQKPLANASVTIKGSKKGIITDSLGNFSLKIEKGKFFIVSYSGFELQEFKATANVKLDIKLIIKPFENDEVVVIGYVTANESYVKAAVSMYKYETLDQQRGVRLEKCF